MAQYMLDLENSVRALRRRNRSLLKKLAESAPSDVCISAVTHSDLQFGAMLSRKSSGDRAAVDIFLRYVGVLGYPAEAGEHYGEIRMVLELGGWVLEPHELLVAAHARCLGLVLVTRRMRELRGVKGMMVENWAAA